MFPRLASLAALMALVCGAATAAPAQEDPRRKPEGAPRLLLNTGGHTNIVRALSFSTDGERLYSGGLDKVVLGWEIRERGKRLRQINADLVQKLHWEISRGLRGAVIELASASLDGKRLLAVGGVSARGQGGDVVVYDAAGGEVQATLEQLRAALATGGLAFSPNGQRLAAVSVDGDLWLWSVPDFTPRQLARSESRERPYRAVAFLDDDTLAAAIPVGAPDADQWGVALYDLSRAGGGPRLLRFVHQGAITTLVRDPNSLRWASADKSGAVYLWDGFDDPQPKLLRRDREALDVAFGADDSLFISTRLQRQRQLNFAEVAFLEHWKTTPPRLVEEVQTATNLDNYACAISPDLRWLAACGDQSSPVLLFALQDVQGKPLENPLTGRDRYKVPLRGVGTTLGKVAFAAKGYQLGFGPHERPIFNDSGPITRVFDLSRTVLLRENEHPQQFRSPDEGAGGWTVHLSEDRYRLDLKHQRGYACSITLDPDEQGEANGYCFLSDAQRTFGIAVGTNHQNGVFVYQLAASGECPLLRYYRDHSNVVFSLSVSSDGKYLASASADQTVKVWSLDGLRHWDEIAAAKRKFSNAVAWGAVFAQRGASVVVAETTPAGIAAARGMQPGDTIVQVAKMEAGARREFNTAEEILNALRSATLFEQLTIVARRNGQDIALPQIVPAWEPTATLFADERREWALFTPHGPYAASPAGAELFGWQVNMGRAVTPKFYEAEKLRNQFEQPGALRALFATGITADLIGKMRGFTIDLTRVAMDTPEIHIEDPLDGRRYQANEEVVIRARIRYPLGQTSANYDVIGLLNGAPAPKPTRRATTDGEVAFWRVRPAELYNGFLVEVDKRGAPPGDPFAQKSVTFRAQEAQERPHLRVLVIAADDYPAAFPAKYTVVDGKGLAEDLERFAKPLYQKVTTYPLLLNREITLPSVRSRIDQIIAELADARPDDLLVVYLGGHGVAFDGEYYFVPAHEKLNQFKDLNKDVTTFGIPWSELVRLSEAGGRKIVFINTCHSGTVIQNAAAPAAGGEAANPAPVAQGADEAEQALARERTSLKKLRDAHMLVITATEGGRLAIEPPGQKHGPFMECIREALAGHADGVLSRADEVEQRKDGTVNLRELVHYLTEHVPQRTRAFAELGGPQTPSHSPLLLFRSLDIPLAQYDAPAPAVAAGAVGE